MCKRCQCGKPLPEMALQDRCVSCTRKAYLQNYQQRPSQPPSGVANCRRIVRELQITQVDHHFAPKRDINESLQIRYRISGYAGSAVKIRITSARYSGDHIVWERPLTAGEKLNGANKLIRWNGEANCGQGVFSGGRLINPLYSPYRVVLDAGGTQSNQVSFSVLYHSIALSMGTYIEDPGHPPAQVDPTPAAGQAQWAAHIRWVQHKLNELGYFAGPVDGNKGAQTDRAIRRYTYTMPGVDETDDATNAGFINALAAGDNPRTLFEHTQVISDPANTQASRIYIDHNYFYYREAGETAWKNQNRADMHAYLDRVKLDRFEFPIEASVKLVSRTDNDGSGAGVDSPEAVGPVEVEWAVLDPPEDMTLLPAHNPPLSPSKGRDYITLVLQATAVNYGNVNDSQDNCPERLGGFRGPNYRYFRSGNCLPPFSCRHNPAAPAAPGPPALPAAPTPEHPAEPNLAAGPVPNAAVNPAPRYFSTIFDDPDNDPPKLGKTAVLFQGSYIAGDNYVITARLSLDSQPNPDPLKQLHVDLTGAASFEQIPKLGARTGKLTVWRRRRVEAVVNWRADAQAINWNEIEQAYAEAHCELTHAARVEPITNVLTAGAPRTAYLQQFQAAFPALCGGGVTLQFNAQQLCPIVLQQGRDEARAGFQNRVDTVRQGLNNQTPQLNILLWIGARIRSFVNQTSPTGMILFCYNLVDQNVATHSPRKRFLSFLWRYGQTTPAAPVRLAVPEAGLGLPDGVAALGRWRRAQWKDRFLFSHEVAHCCYLMHSWNAWVGAGGCEKPQHHDKHDFNCLMCYPFTRVWRGIRNINLGRAAAGGNNYVMHFCGKCLLKLRGWKVVDPQAAVLPLESQTMNNAQNTAGGYNAANDLDDDEAF